MHVWTSQSEFWKTEVTISGDGYVVLKNKGLSTKIFRMITEGMKVMLSIVGVPDSTGAESSGLSESFQTLGFTKTEVEVSDGELVLKSQELAVRVLTMISQGMTVTVSIAGMPESAGAESSGLSTSLSSVVVKKPCG